MSRTIKRKNFEREHKKVHGSSVNGYYTSLVFHFSSDGFFWYTYELPLPDELWKLKRRAHSENQESWRTFKKDERNIVEKQYRSQERRRIVKYLHGKTEDIIHEKLPKYPKHWWA